MLTKQQKQRFEELKSELEQMTGYTYEQIKSPSRKRDLAFTRYAVTNGLRLCGWHLLDIGGVLGGRDHSTVIHGLTSFKNMEEGYCGNQSDKIKISEKIYLFMTLDKNYSENTTIRRNIANKMLSNGSSLYSVVCVV